MAVVVGIWVFDGGCVPALADVAEGLREMTALEVVVEGGVEDPVLSLPSLAETLFDWKVDAARIEVHSFVPAHPYLWESLDALFGALGGRLSSSPNIWQPNPAHASLRRPWPRLSLRQRWILRTRTIGASRPLDALLPRTEV